MPRAAAQHLVRRMPWCRSVSPARPDPDGQGRGRCRGAGWTSRQPPTVPAAAPGCSTRTSESLTSRVLAARRGFLTRRVAVIPHARDAVSGDLAGPVAAAARAGLGPGGFNPWAGVDRPSCTDRRARPAGSPRSKWYVPPPAARPGRAIAGWLGPGRRSPPARIQATGDPAAPAPTLAAPASGPAPAEAAPTPAAPALGGGGHGVGPRFAIATRDAPLEGGVHRRGYLVHDRGDEPAPPRRRRGIHSPAAHPRTARHHRSRCTPRDGSPDWSAGS